MVRRQTTKRTQLSREHQLDGLRALAIHTEKQRRAGDPRHTPPGKARLGPAIRNSFRATPEDWQGETLRVHGQKTRDSDGTIVVTPIAAPFLEYAWRFAPRWKEEQFLFKPWLKVHRDICAACVRAGIDKVTPNDLRRTFATWHHQAGVAPWIIGKLLRHVDSTMAELVYARSTPGSLSAVLSTVPGVYPAGRENGYKPGSTAGPKTLDQAKKGRPRQESDLRPSV